MNSKLKVLHVLNTGKYSGAENVVITIISSMKNVDCVYAALEGPIVDILDEYGISYCPIGKEKILLKQLNKVIELVNPDIIHAHDFTAGIKAVMTGTKIPIINHLHSNVPWLKKICLKSIVFLLFSKKYKKILTVSESVIDEFVFRDCINEKIITVGNPIDIETIKQKMDNAGCKEKSDIIFLGRMSEEKNPLLFIEIVFEVSKIIPDINVVMIGDGKLKNQVIKKIKEMNLEHIIQLYGFMKNPYGLLKQSKLLCIPSSWEGFGLSAVEALALSKPVVAANVGGLKKIVNEKCGFLCDDKQEYIDAIVNLLEDEICYEKKRQGAIARSYELDNLKSYIKNIYSIYEELLERDISEK